MNWLDEINWNADGLVPAIAQDHKTGRVLMMAWMNREALQLTAQENRAIYWSRSRGKLWRKGEESGHVQQLHELRLDCDADVIILMVEHRLPHRSRKLLLPRVRERRLESRRAGAQGPARHLRGAQA